MCPRDAFPGFDDPVNVDLDHEDALKLLLGADEVAEAPTDEIEPILDD
ncbi:MAG: hypothetical protein ACLQOZ_15555 [Acidimicrobiales bacterium]|jgi:hypothetical protein